MTNCLLLLAALILQDSGSGMAVNANQRVCYCFSMNYIIDCRYSLDRKCNYAMWHARLSRYPTDMSLMFFLFPSIPASLPVHPSVKLSPSLPHSKTYFLGVTRRNLGCSFGRSEESIHQQLSWPLLEACFLPFCLSFISPKPVYLPIPSYGCLLTWSLVFKKSQCLFLAFFLANTSSYITPQTPAPTNHCTPRLLFSPPDVFSNGA